jgi:hypothetical protein
MSFHLLICLAFLVDYATCLLSRRLNVLYPYVVAHRLACCPPSEKTGLLGHRALASQCSELISRIPASKAFPTTCVCFWDAGPSCQRDVAASQTLLTTNFLGLSNGSAESHCSLQSGSQFSTSILYRLMRYSKASFRPDLIVANGHPLMRRLFPATILFR